MFREPILLLKRLVLLSIGGLFLYWGYSVFAKNHNHSRIAAVASIFFMWFAGWVAGQIFGRVGGEIIGNKLADAIMHPRVFLTRRPVVISRAMGLIQQHQYHEAEQELLKILAESPRSQPAVIVLGQLYLDNLHDYEKAEQVLANYLCHRLKVRPNEVNVVNLYIDACLAQGKKAEALARLNYELKQRGYAGTERKSLIMRRISLSSQS